MMMNVYELENVLDQRKIGLNKIMKHEWKFYANYSEIKPLAKKGQTQLEKVVSPCCA